MKHTLIPMSAREVLTAIHRGKNACVNVEGPHGDIVIQDGEENREWKVLASNTVDGLLSCPILAPWLKGEQVYFSLSSVYRAAWREYRSDVTGLTVYSREELQFLNVVCIDIDIAHEEGSQLDFDAQAQEVVDFTVNRGLPYPSIMCDSGRGVWLYWLTRDRLHQGQPLGAWPNLQAFHSRLLSAAVAAYRNFNSGADSSCTDSQRVARFPGSINAKSGTAARYFRTSDQVFTLPELADAFGVKARKTAVTRQEAQATKCTGKCDCKCAGQRYDDAGKPRRPVCATMRAQAALARWRVPLGGLRKLAEIRGRFKKGQRTTAAYLFAAIGKRAKLPKLLSEAIHFAGHHCPGLELNDIKKCVRAVRKSWMHISNARIAEMLKITDVERAQLSSWLKPAEPTKAAEITYRRSILKAEIVSHGQLSIRKAVYFLAQHGIRCSRSRIAADLQHIKANLEGRGLKRRPPAPLFPLHGKINAKTENPKNCACSVVRQELGTLPATTGTSKKNGTPDIRRAQ